MLKYLGIYGCNKENFSYKKYSFRILPEIQKILDSFPKYLDRGHIILYYEGKLPIDFFTKIGNFHIFLSPSHYYYKNINIVEDIFSKVESNFDEKSLLLMNLEVIPNNICRILWNDIDYNKRLYVLEKGVFNQFIYNDEYELIHQIYFSKLITNLTLGFLLTYMKIDPQFNKDKDYVSWWKNNITEILMF